MSTSTRSTQAPSRAASSRGSAATPFVRSGRSVRRWVLVGSPVLAGLFAVLGAAMDPAVGESGLPLFEKYAANPEPLQWKSIGFHYSYALWLLPAVMLAGYVRGRGVWLANTGAALGWLGLTTLPGFLPLDFYDSAVGQVAGPETTAAVGKLIDETMWGLPVIVAPGMVGFVLAVPLATVAAWRAGLLRWWAPVAAVAGFLAFMLSNITWWGCLVLTGFLTVLAVDLARGTARVPQIPTTA